MEVYMDSAFNRKRVILMFLLPAFILYTAVVIVSIVWSTYYSFFDWDGMGKMTFIGIKNFINLYTMDKNFWPVVTNTLIYTVLEISLQVFGGLLIAIFLTRVTRGRATLQTFYYMPVVISSVAISQIFNKLFSVTPTGLINAILGWLNAEWLTLEWISNPKTSLALCAFVEGYKYAGLYMVIFYAALIAVPEDLTEAAKIDGASVLRQYWNVKLPYILPVIVTNCVLVLNGSLRSFDISFLLTGGGPGNTSELIAAYMYKQAFTSMKYGYGSAVAVSNVILCLVLGMTFRRLQTGRRINI
jgi:raffinose/stachyose/melibiose transport system permease protein